MAPEQKKISQGQELANYIRSLEDFEIFHPNGPVYNHMGAIIADAVLQAGLNYKNVVFPRIRKILEDFPDEKTTSQFREILNKKGVKEVINWKDQEKPERLEGLTNYLVEQEVETVDDMRTFLLKPEAAASLLKLKGIGPKTVDYLKVLVDIPAIAVDRHVFNFVERAGIICKGYSETRLVVEEAARELNLSFSALDHSIWQYMSN